MPAHAPPPNYSLLFYISGKGVAGETAVVDRGPYNIPVSLAGGAAISSLRSKFYDTSFYLNGTTGYISANGVSAKVAGLEYFTIAGWFWLEAIIPVQNTLFGFHTSAGENRLCIGHNSVFGGTGLTTTAMDGGPASIGEWFHIALVVSVVEKTLKIYRNGIEVHSQAWTGTASTVLSTDRFTIGQEWDSGAASDFMRGSVQDLFVASGKTYSGPFTPPERMTGSLTGTVVDEYGNPAIRRIVAIPREGPLAAGFDATTDAVGNYTFDNVLRGMEYTLLCFDDSPGTVRQDLAKRAKSL